MLALGGIVGLLLAGSGIAYWSNAPLTRWDTAEVEFAYFHAVTGEPIYASSERLAHVLSESRSSPSLFSPYGPAFSDRLPSSVGQASAPSPIADFIASELEGERPGDVIRTSVLPGGLGSWEDEIVLQKHLGPFPMEHTHPRNLFESKYGVPEVGMRIPDEEALDSQLVVTDFNEAIVTYRNILLDGQRVTVRKLEWNATVSVDPASNTFRLELKPEIGVVGNVLCNNPALGDVPPFTGAIRVESMNDTAIRLLHSSFPFPHLVEEPVYAEIHVLGVQRFAQLGFHKSSTSGESLPEPHRGAGQNET